MASFSIVVPLLQQLSLKVTISLLLKSTSDLLLFSEHKLYGFPQSGNGISDINARLDRLIEEISDNNIKLNDLSKEIWAQGKYKNIQWISDKKFKEINNKLKNNK